MVVVLVKWKIKPGHEETFIEHWEKELRVGEQRDLIGEFLCKPEAREYATWGLPEPDDPPCHVFVNVGFWVDESAFLEQISPYFSNNEAPMPFEASKRVRTVMNAESWRIGEAFLPRLSSDGVV